MTTGRGRGISGSNKAPIQDREKIPTQVGNEAGMGRKAPSLPMTGMGMGMGMGMGKFVFPFPTLIPPF